MAFALVSSVQTSGANGSTSSSINTTGATLLTAELSFYAGTTFGSAPPITDSKGNTWYGGRVTKGSLAWSQIYYAYNPTVGTGHTFTVTGSAIYYTCQFQAWSGAYLKNPLNVLTATGPTAGVASLSTGSITPTVNDTLVVAHLAQTDGTSGTSTINGGFTIDNQSPFQFGVKEGGVGAYLIQTTAAAANPTITVGAGTGQLAASIASFLPDTVANWTDPIVASTKLSGGVNGGTTGSINTTGAVLIVISVLQSNAVAAATVSDSKSNTWTALTAHNTGGIYSRIYYCLNPVVGSGHTFTIAGTNAGPEAHIMAFNVGTAFENEAGASVANSTAYFYSPTTFTPTANNCLCIANWGASKSSFYPVSTTSKLLISNQSIFVTGNHQAGASAYTVQGTAEAMTPYWSGYDRGADIDMGVSFAAFRTTAASSGPRSQVIMVC